MTRPIAGLFGKLPAQGDFVRRGWPDATVDAIDRWLTGGLAAARDTRDDDAFAAWMHAAPLWQGYAPPGALGPLALHLALAPSIDRAGRLFPIAVGIAGEAEAVWAQAVAGLDAMLDEAIYDALAGRGDADALVDRIDGAIADAPMADEAPTAMTWWLGTTAAAPGIVGDAIDAALLERLFSVGVLTGVHA